MNRGIRCFEDGRERTWPIGRRRIPNEPEITVTAHNASRQSLIDRGGEPAVHSVDDQPDPAQFTGGPRRTVGAGVVDHYRFQIQP